MNFGRKKFNKLTFDFYTHGTSYTVHNYDIRAQCYNDQYSGHCTVVQRLRYKSKFEKKNQNSLLSTSSMKSLRRQTQFFSYKFSVLKFAFTVSKCIRMHHFEAIFQKFPWEDPRTPTCGRGWRSDPLPHPPPFGASRLSEAFSFRPVCAPAVFNRAPEEKKLDIPGMPIFVDGGSSLKSGYI